MTPLFFGSSKRRLFGVYSPARAIPGRNRAALLCYPWGNEYINAHRSFVRLAAMLADRGYHVLRFDYFATGDSSGETEEATLAGWREDIATAFEELRDMSGVERVSLVGLRVGATLAAEIVAEGDLETDTLVLWDPVVSGAEYVESLFQRAARMQYLNPPLKASEADARNGREIMGFPLTDGLRQELERLDLTGLFPGLRRPPLVITSEPLASHPGLVETLQAQHDGAEMETFEDHRPWTENWPVDTGRLPTLVLERIANWMDP